MEWMVAVPLPVECQNCQEEDCYNCDTAGKRWYLPREEELRLRRKGLVKAIERLQRQIQEIDRELLPFTDQQKAAMTGKIEMTYDLFWECLEVCFHGDNMDKYFEIWNQHPEHIQELKRRANQEPNRSRAQASWEKLKARLVEELGEDWVAENCVD